MFSIVQNIASALKPLEVEAADARLQKKKDDPEIGGDDSSNSGAHDTAYQDDEREGSFMSVKSIILFLEDFIEARLESKAEDRTFLDDESTMAPWLKAKHSNDSASIPSDDAIRAYVQASQTVAKYSNPAASPVPKSVPARENDIREAYALIKVLRSLEDQGIKHLKVDSQAPFIRAVSEAASIKQSSL